MHSKTAKLGHSSWTRKILTNASALQRSEFHDPDQHRKQMVYYLYWNIWPWKRFHKDLLTTSSFLYLHHYLHHSLPKSNQLLPVTHFPNSHILCLTDGKVGTGNAMYSPLSKVTANYVLVPSPSSLEIWAYDSTGAYAGGSGVRGVLPPNGCMVVHN